MSAKYPTLIITYCDDSVAVFPQKTQAQAIDNVNNYRDLSFKPAKSVLALKKSDWWNDIIGEWSRTILAFKLIAS